MPISVALYSGSMVLGHTTELCPKRAADVRGDTSKCLADSERTGRVCEMCGFGDHTDIHHRLAAADAQFALTQGKISWAGGQQNVRGGGAGAEILGR